AARRSAAPRTDGCRHARGGQTGRCRRDRRGADRACGRLRAAGSGSSGSAVRGSRHTRSSRGPGGRRSAAGTGSRRRPCSRSPAWLIGAPSPQLGANAGAGEGWLVVEGDESDRSAFALPAEIAVVTNIELDHHSEFRSLAELKEEFARWTATVPHVVRDAEPF